jgi:hypothetical protein
MVRAYAESLLEQVLKTDRVRPDKDGDYPVRYQSALYYVRIVPGQSDDPVVQVFAIALAGHHTEIGALRAVERDQHPITLRPDLLGA